MNMEEIILNRIRQTLAPPEPPPIFVAEIRYPREAWYELADARDMTQEELAHFLKERFSLEEQAQALRLLEKARREVASPCGLRLIVLYQRDDRDALYVDDIRFMEPTQLTAFQMQSGQEKASFQWEAAALDAAQSSDEPILTF